MKVLAVPSDEEFDSLPPPLQRKCYSNDPERVPLQLVLPQTNRRIRTRHGSRRLHFGSPRNRTVASGLIKECGLERPRYYSRKLCKPRSLQLAYLAAQADSQCFHSLPTKIQQRLFSEQERLRFLRACQHFVVGAADPQAADTQTYPPLHRRSSQSTVPFSQAPTLYIGPLDKGETMDDSLYNNFRWLDEDAELDLTLDGYHAHNANELPKPPTRRRSSFQRPLSFNPANFARKSSVIRHTRLPSLTRTFHAPPTSNTSSRASTTGPPSRNDVPRSSTSSIEPAAQYYQDPDARWKLRAFLSSPQKFDEAIQFGFPALESKESRSSEQQPAEAELVLREVKGTFWNDDDDKSPSWDRNEPDQRRDLRSNDNKGGPVKPTLCTSQRRSISQECPGSREMTLKMTLTRPDLRTESSTPSPVGSKLGDTDVPAGDGGRTQELELDDQGTVRKMWRKLWKQKG